MLESASGGGVWSRGVSGPGGAGCLLPGGVSAARGVCSRRVSAPGGGGGIPACTEADPPCEQNDRQV